MDWVKEILTILGSIVTVFGLLSVPKLFADLSFIRKIDYDEWEKFKQREKEFDENTKLFEKEALLKTVGFLKNFTWKEYFVLSQCDIGLKDIKSINILKRTENIEFDGLIFFDFKRILK